MHETKDLKLELKSLDEEGKFAGYLSVYDVPDLVGDLVEHGAFTKTISEQKGIIPMFWNHDPHQPIGAFNLSDDPYGLKVDGNFFLKESPRALEIHGIAKRFHELGRPMGLSIGFRAIQKMMQDGIRHLKEIRLFEGSLTLLPALPQAQIADIKSILTEQFKGDMDAYLEHLLTLLAIEVKAGRRIGAASRAFVQEVITKLQALSTEDISTSVVEAAVKSEPGAASQVIEPDALHSWLKPFCEEWKAGLKSI